MTHKDGGRNSLIHLAGVDVILALVLSSFSLAAFSDTPPATKRKGRVDTITVESARKHEKVEQQVLKFVSGIAVTRSDQSLANWRRDVPICPLVAGLSREDGEFLLRRLSRIAVAAGAPLAPEHCRPNLYVVVTSEPDTLLKAWNKRDVTLFDNGDDHGGHEVRKFLDAKLPVRAWYNIEIYNSDGTPLNYRDTSPGLGLQGARKNVHAVASRIQFDDVRNLSSVIVLVDATRVKGVSFGQLAAYIGMVGLAEIKIHAKASDTPSIMQLFSDSGKSTTNGLTEWDEPF